MKNQFKLKLSILEKTREDIILYHENDSVNHRGRSLKLLTVENVLFGVVISHDTL